MEFAVRVVLDAPDKARWVLAVDPVEERLLLTGDDRKLRWVPMWGCAFAKVADPRMVIPVQVQEQSKVARVTPTLVRGNHG